MGLGKSLTAIIWMDMCKVDRVLMVVPNDTTQNMMRELNHWAPHRNVVDLSGHPKMARDMVLRTLDGMDNFVLIVNYEINRRDKDFINNILNLQIEAVIADESHNVKNNKTAAFKMVKGILTEPNCCSECSSKNVKSGAW
jgi:SNF2 family DNA or RNA helicase